MYIFLLIQNQYLKIDIQMYICRSLSNGNIILKYLHTYLRRFIIHTQASTAFEQSRPILTEVLPMIQRMYLNTNLVIEDDEILVFILNSMTSY